MTVKGLTYFPVAGRIFNSLLFSADFLRTLAAGTWAAMTEPFFGFGYNITMATSIDRSVTWAL